MKLLSALAVITFLLFGSQLHTAEVKDLVLMSSTVGGIGYQYTMGISKVIQKVLPDIRTTMEATPGYIDNAKRLHAGYGHLGIVSMDTAMEIFERRGDFSTEGVRLVALFPVHKLDWNIVVHAESQIKSVADLAGKRVNLQPKGSSAERTASAVFRVLGLEVKPSYYSHAEAVDGLRTGRIDAHWLGGTNSILMEYSLRKPIRVLSFSDAEIKKITSQLPFLTKSTFPAGMYYKGASDAQVVSTWSILMGRADLPDEIVYKIVKGVYENKEIMITAHKGAETMDPKDIVHVKVPVHPGAIKYYKEVGIWPLETPGTRK